MSSPDNTEQCVAQLCPACGLCCNGVLFGDVELQLGDSAQVLELRGLALRRKRRKLVFNQPCSCFDGTLCRIYPDRPTRCRTFECGTLKRAQAGEITPAAALKRIEQARAQVQVVLGLMRALGDTTEELPLSRRYSRIMAQPLDLAGDEDVIETRAKLMLEVAQLMAILHRDFLS